MIGFIIAFALYLIGLVGFYTTATDLNHGPIKTWRARATIVFWPLVIPIGFAGDIYDGYWGRR